MQRNDASGPRACRPCAVGKAKCIFLLEGVIPNGKCTRCNRLNKICTSQTPATRRSRAPRFTHLKGKSENTAPLLQSPNNESGASDLPSPLYPKTPSLPILSTSSSGVQCSSQTPFFSGPSAFLGPTSFSAVFHEHRENFEHEPNSETPSFREMEPSIRSTKSAVEDQMFSSDHIRLGSKVLAQIPNEAACKLLFSRHVNPNDGWIRLAGEKLSDSIWVTLNSSLCKENHEDHSLSLLISRNTNSELLEEEEPNKWMASFSGINLRWEALGILFTYWSFGAMSSPEHDSIFSSTSESLRKREDVMIEFKECAASCIALCSHTNRGNPLLVYLLYKHSLLETMISGDASLIYWRQHGDLCAMTTALGMHRDIDQRSKTVSVNSEMRRRIYAAVFNIDKVICTFTGRPVMLNHRYSSTPLPLDISDEDLLSGEDNLSKVVKRLDANGWNSDGQIYSTTILRARTSFSFIRSEILDIAFASVSDGIEERILDLKRRSKSTYLRLPDVIICCPDDLSNPHLSSWTLYSRLLARLEHLQNLFLLERMLVKHGNTNAQELIEISKEMLVLTSGIWKERDRLLGLHGDFEWLIMYHAVPASGILCIELLKQTKDANYRLVIPRSDSIQDLVMFVGFLDWVKPSAPNYQLCRRIRGIIGRVLEEVLETLPTAQITATATQVPLDFCFDSDVRGFDEYATFDLLDTFDWFNESWVTQI